MIVGDRVDLIEAISVIDKYGQVDRHIEEFTFYEGNPDYRYQGYRRVNGIVYHVFHYLHTPP